MCRPCRPYRAGAGVRSCVLFVRNNLHMYVRRLVVQQWIGKVWINLLRSAPSRARTWKAKSHTQKAPTEWDLERESAATLGRNSAKCLLAFRKPPSSPGLRCVLVLGSRLYCGRLINDKSPKSFLSANANACQFGLLTLLRLVRRETARQTRQEGLHRATFLFFACVCFLACLFSRWDSEGFMNESQSQPG